MGLLPARKKGQAFAQAMPQESTLHASFKRRQRRFRARLQRRWRGMARWLDRLLPAASLKTYVVAVILLAMLPIAVLLTWKVAGDARSGRTAAVALLQQSAASAAQAAAQDLAASTDALTALSLVEWLQQGELEAFEKHLRQTPLRRPQWRSVFLTDAVGRMLLDTASPNNAPLPRHEETRTLVFKVLARGRAAVSGVSWLGAEGTQVVVVAVPVYQGGVVQHVLGARMATATWLRLLDSLSVPEHGFIALFDSEQRVLALKHRTGTAQELALHADESVQLAGAMAAALKNAGDATRHTAGLLDATPVLAAWHQVEGTEWKAGVGMASGPIEAAEHAIVLSALTTMGACLLLGVSLALLLAWRLAEPLRRMASGSAVSPLQPLPVLELARLRQSLLAARQRSESARHLLQRKTVDFDTLFNHVPIGLAFAEDGSGTRVRHNPAMRQLMGETAAGRGGSTAELLHRGRVLAPLEHPLVRACRRAETVQGMEMEVRVEGRAPAQVVTSAVPLPDAQGRPRGAISATVDTTETRQVVALWLAAEADRHARQLLADVAQEAGQVGFFEYRYRSDTLACTPGMWQLLGVPEDQPLARLQQALVLLDASDRQLVRRTLAAALAEGAANIGFGCRVQAQGEIGAGAGAGARAGRWLWCQVQVHYTGDGRPGHMTGTVVDATALQQAQLHDQGQAAHALQAARAQAEADHRDRDRLLHLLGHELRNPLGAITSALEVLHSGAGGSAGAERALAVIGRQARHLSDRVRGMLEAGRAGASHALLEQALPDSRSAPAVPAVPAAFDVPAAPAGQTTATAVALAPGSAPAPCRQTSQDPQQHQLQPRHAGPAPCSLVLLQAGGGLRQSLQTALELDGHHVTALDGGPQGLELLLALRPDAVLVDTELPGLDGLQLALHARAGGYAGRMVALSGAGNPPAGQREALMKAGFDACLARPVDAQQCRAALQGRSSC